MEDRKSAPLTGRMMALVVIALVLGGGGLGLGAYAIDAAAGQEPADPDEYAGHIIQVKSDINTSSYITNPTSFLTCMTVNIDVQAGSFLWCSASAEFRLESQSAPVGCFYRIVLDSTVVIAGGCITLYADDDPDSVYVRVVENVSPQGMSGALPAGAHDVEFQFWGFATMNGAGGNSTLTVMEIGG